METKRELPNLICSLKITPQKKVTGCFDISRMQKKHVDYHMIHRIHLRLLKTGAILRENVDSIV